MAHTRRTSAVVVIHGIGEQRPMDTARRFVKAVVEPADSGPVFYSKPDTLSGSLELRKLQNRQQPRVHYFEYYWASHVEGTKLAHVVGWSRNLLFRIPSRVPQPLRGLWLMAWVLTLILLTIWVLVGVSATRKVHVGATPFLIGGAATIAWGAAQGFLIGSLGDAARYLSPLPDNIALRRAIRDEGVQLLRNLHDAKDGDRARYETITLVGHSLGSVIAYDMIRQFWAERHASYETPHPSEQPFLRDAEAAAEHGDVHRYQELQPQLLAELDQLGLAWRIDHLVTLGSPLAHADMLMANDADELRARMAERELPLCPPLLDEAEGDGRSRFSYRLWGSYGNQRHRFHLRALHHAAPFGPTRWTNLYVPTRFGLFGDRISGPLAPLFGAGVNDVEVRGPTWLSTHTPLSHSAYWKLPPQNLSGRSQERRRPGKGWRERPLALVQLRAALTAPKERDPSATRTER